jgi:predicted ATP-grasp superfamily ATP-dependent carboligase
MILGPSRTAPTAPPLVLVGTSVRAAAWSALRAGFRPLCCDQFADADLQAVAWATRISSLGDLVPTVSRFPPAPLVYTGGLENHPELIEQLAESRPVWGLDVKSLRSVRNPIDIVAALASARLPHLEVRGQDAPPPADGTWLLKPQRSGGGRGIVPWTDDAASSATRQEPHYFQQRLAGPSYSGLFIAREAVGDVRFVGLTEQLVGDERLHARPFAWCGNIGPVALDVRVEHGIRRIANYLKWKFALRGVFGLDFIVAADGRMGVTEINPRYPASLEILEYATGTTLLRDHAECFATEELPEVGVRWEPLPGRVLGKAVVFSPRAVTTQFDLPIEAEGFRSWPRWADVPAPGTVVQAGEPLLTVYAQGDTAAECRAGLQESAESILAAL